jgi:predicted component of type VI protein secretion system
MPRLELIVQPPGKAPTTVPLDRPLVVGRSRRVDLTVEDEEVGREQFRIVLDDGDVVLESIGKTNQTLVDDVVLPPGMKRPLFDGTTIRVGRTSFRVRNAEATTGAPPPAMATPEMTMVAQGPIGLAPRTPPAPAAPPPAAPPPVADQTSSGASPMRTLPVQRPGAAPPDGAAADPAVPERTLPLVGGPGRRPGPARPADAAPRPPTPPPPAATPPPPPAPRAEPKPPAPPPPAPPPPAPPAVRATTVAVEPADIAAELGQIAAPKVAAVDVEANLQARQPRLLVKCEGIKRRCRLVRARTSLGRGAAADLQLANDSVSELHAEITFDGAVWTVQDRGSTNGTFVDGTQLRGNSQAIGRHSLLGLGSVRAIFLSDEPGRSAAERRLEADAVKLLVGAGRLPADAAREALRITRVDPGQSVAELLLMDTTLTAAEWATAVATARSRPSLPTILRNLLARLLPDKRPPAAPR